VQSLCEHGIIYTYGRKGFVPSSLAKGQTMKNNKIKKGSLVKLDVAKCFTTDNGGLRDRWNPLQGSTNDENGVVDGTRLATREDYERWVNSDASKGMNSAGESKLSPTCFRVALHRDKVYTVLRSRCRGHWSYREHPGQALILDTETGHEVYISRELLEVAA